MSRCAATTVAGVRCGHRVRRGRRDCGRHPHVLRPLAVTTAGGDPTDDPFATATAIDVPARLASCCPDHATVGQVPVRAGDTWLFDLDGTLVDVTEAERRHLSSPDKKKRNMRAFHMEGLVSPANEDVADLARHVDAAGGNVVAMTAREDPFGHASVFWLQEHNVPFERLYSRAKGDGRGDTAVKAELLDEVRSHGHHVTRAVDDRPGVVDLWCSKDIPTFVVPSARWGTAPEVRS